MSTKSLPYPINLTAENATLGSILLDPELIGILDLDPSDFLGEKHNTIYQAMSNLWAAGMPIDFHMLTDELERMGKYGEVVSSADLTRLMESLPTAIYGPHYAAAVRRTSIARKYVMMAQKLAEMAYQEQDADTLYSWIMEQVAAINSGNLDDKALLMWGESFEAFRQILRQDALRREAGEVGWPWPWRSWTDVLGEAQPGGVVLLAGPTGTGKTTFAETIAEYWARLGKKIVLVHLELNRKVLLARRMARHTALDFRAIVAGNLTDAQRSVMDRADASLQEWVGNIHYLHAPGWSAEQIVRELSKLQERGQCDGFIVDYMQKLAPSPGQIRLYRSDHLKREANDAEQFKNFAEQRELICVLLNQLVKEAQDIPFSKLSYSGLRGTQELADKVNVIGLFHRQRLEKGKIDEYGRQVVAKGGLDLTVRTKVDKNTFGPLGEIEQVIIPEQFNIFDREG